MQECSWAPHIGREAIEELERKDREYYRHDDLILGCTEDLGPWIPSDDVKEYVPNIETITIEFIDSQANLTDIDDCLAQSEHIGLVLIGRNITRTSKPSLIVLTTPSKYYAIDPKDSNFGMQYLKTSLLSPKLTFWTTNGLDEADCLLRNYGIKLLNSRARCCLGLHLHLMKVLSRQPETVKIYPERAMRLAKQSWRLESYTRMLWIWLGLDGTSEFEINLDQIIHLNRRPLNQTAINVIKKRCALVITLSQYLRYYARLELEIMNDNTMNCLSKISVERTKRAMRRMMKKCEKDGVVSPTYFSYLDGTIRLDKI